MADLRATEAAADARLAAAKLRLLRLADEASRPPALVRSSAAFVRRAPWQGLAIAFLAGVALGMAPRSTLGRLGPLLGPLLGPVIASATGVGATTGRPTDAAGSADANRSAA